MPTSLLSTAWRNRRTGEVARYDGEGIGLALFGVDEMDGHNGLRYVLADEAELRRDWVEVRRGWVVAETSPLPEVALIYENGSIFQLVDPKKGGGDG